MIFYFLCDHLDGALKECMRQIRNLKEDHEKELREVISSKTRQWEIIKQELEAKMISLDQELLRSAAENTALSRSLQERSNMLIKLNDEKLKAEARIEILKGDIESCENAEILILGRGRQIEPVHPDLRRFVCYTCMKLEVLDTRNAVSTYNILNEEGRIVAAALIPYGVTSS
ncbi:hypothetical protein MLD38_023770 [Melastoma candidum]|uniref:Uncharacterized protein n=1 Tax=Melastoma candidum TaxID=119954 RepID=A0ACB9NR59_9MYRT|nr:hypothetical protein MLD38_023770 [Melastoma candidum]